MDDDLCNCGGSCALPADKVLDGCRRCRCAHLTGTFELWLHRDIAPIQTRPLELYRPWFLPAQPYMQLTSDALISAAHTAPNTHLMYDVCLHHIGDVDAGSQLLCYGRLAWGTGTSSKVVGCSAISVPTTHRQQGPRQQHNHCGNNWRQHKADSAVRM